MLEERLSERKRSVLRRRKESSSRSPAERSSPGSSRPYVRDQTRRSFRSETGGERMDWHSFVSYLRRHVAHRSTPLSASFLSMSRLCRRQARAGMPEEPIAEAAKMRKVLSHMSIDALT